MENNQKRNEKSDEMNTSSQITSALDLVSQIIVVGGVINCIIFEY